MPFNNPIVAGEELIRSSMRSENFKSAEDSEISDGDGWAVFRDGRAEFSGVSVRGNTSGQSAAYDDFSVTNDLFYQGNELQALLDARARGVVVWGELDLGTNTLQTSTKLGILELDTTLHSGRMYRVYTNAMHLFQDDGEGYTRLAVTYTTNGTRPLVSSPYLISAYKYADTGGRGARADTQHISRTLVVSPTDPPSSFPLKVLLSMESSDGGTVTLKQYSNGNKPQLIIEDVGPSSANSWIPNNGYNPPPVTGAYKTFLIGPYASRSYDGAGNNIGYENQYAMQGDIGIDGNRRSWIWFDANNTSGGNGLGSINDMQGADSLDYFDVYLNYDHWYFATGTASIGCHASNLVTATEQGGALYDRKRQPGWGRDVGQWVSLLGTDIATQALAGALEGIVLGNTGTADRTFYGYAHGANGVSGQAPGLRAGYYK